MRPHFPLRRLVAPLCAALFGALASLALAPPGAPLAQNTPEIISASDGPVFIEVGQGKLIRVDRDVSTVFAADPNIADVQVTSPRLIYVIARGEGDTTIFAVDEDEKVMAGIPLTVGPSDFSARTASRRLKDILARMYPELDLKVSVLGKKVLVEGQVPTPMDVERIRALGEASFVASSGGGGGFFSFFGGGSSSSSSSNVLLRLTVKGSNQVNLRVRIAEVSRSVTKALGIDWTEALLDGGLEYGFATVNPFAAAGNITSTLGYTGDTFSIDAALSAMEEEGMISILAEPNLTAVSGESASFLAGGEFPILYPDGDGGTLVEFKEYGVSLGFTPTIIGPGRISLDVRPEVSQIDTTNSVTLGNFSVPGLTTRRVETTVELASGQSFAVAGLIQNNISESLDRFPGLGKVPVLGRLFTSDEFLREETELVIIVTPYLVKPSAGPLPTPVDGLVPPTDGERMLNDFSSTRVRPVTKTDPTGGEAPAHNGPLGFMY